MRIPTNNVDRDGGMFVGVVQIIERLRHRVADIERFDATIKVVGDESVDGWFGHDVRVLRHDQTKQCSELIVEHKKSVEEIIYKSHVQKKLGFLVLLIRPWIVRCLLQI